LSLLTERTLPIAWRNKSLSSEVRVFFATKADFVMYCC
jgi:hypothetical protein